MIPGITAHVLSGFDIIFNETMDTFDTVGMTATAWNTVDLTTYGVPANAVCVFICSNDDANDFWLMGVRRVGSAINRYFLHTEGESGGASHNTMWVKADASSQVQVYAAKAHTELTYSLIGWWESAVGFTERLGSIGFLTNSTTWWDEDIFGANANDIVTVLASLGILANQISVGIREPDLIATTTDTILLNETEDTASEANHWSRTVQLNANKELSIYHGISPGSFSYFDLGAITGVTLGQDNDIWNAQHTATGTSAWETWTLDSSVPLGSVVEVTCQHFTIGSEALIGVRGGGSSLTRYVDIHEAEGSATSCNTAVFLATVDSNRQIEIYTGDNTAFFRIAGWFELA